MLLLLVGLATAPLWLTRVGLYQYLALEIMIWMLFALGYNLLLGYGGLPSFGHGAFFGIGAYTETWLLWYGLLFMAMVLWQPEGIAGAWQAWRRRFHAPTQPAHAAPRAA